MPNVQPVSSAQQHVSVTYGDGSHSFWLERDATLAELAIHVGALDALHDSAPLAVNIAFEPSRRHLRNAPLLQQITD